jgi:hypothetical protein
MRDWSQQQSPSEVVAVLSDLELHPAQTFYHSWNWKAASLSAMLRAPLFLAATMRQGPEAVTIAVFAGAGYSAAISGIAPLEAMASGVPLVAANTGGITSYATEANAWLAEPTEAAFADAIRQVFQDHGARLAKVREGLATAFAHRWDFSLYDAIHAEFRAGDTLACSPAYAWSTPATLCADAVIAASSALPRHSSALWIGSDGKAPVRK